jgi:hypothetical protein
MPYEKTREREREGERRVDGAMKRQRERERGTERQRHGGYSETEGQRDAEI